MGGDISAQYSPVLLRMRLRAAGLVEESLHRLEQLEAVLLHGVDQFTGIPARATMSL
jgi:hypothetical protein